MKGLRGKSYEILIHNILDIADRIGKFSYMIKEYEQTKVNLKRFSRKIIYEVSMIERNTVILIN